VAFRSGVLLANGVTRAADLAIGASTVARRHRLVADPIVRHRRSARAKQSRRTYRGEVTGSAYVNSRLLAQALWLG
jgi:hypothetical protein